MENIKVSTIIPVYKVSLEYLQVCLDSLANQTMLDCEFIIVGDGASEAEASVCDKYTKKDSRFKFFRNEHQGVSTARNFGMEQAQGEYVTFVDADDWIAPETCQIVYNYAVSNHSDVLLWDMMKEYPQMHGGDRNWYNQNIGRINANEKLSILTNLIFPQQLNIARGCPAKLYNKKFLISNNIKFSTNLAIGEDVLFNIQAINSTKKISYLSTILYFYRQHSSSVTHCYLPNIWENIKYYETQIKEYIPKSLHKTWATDVVLAFFWSWQLNYLNRENKKGFLSKFKEMRAVIKSQFFDDAFHSMDITLLSSKMKFEIHLLRFFPNISLFLHILKNQFTIFCLPN